MSQAAVQVTLSGFRVAMLGLMAFTSLRALLMGDGEFDPPNAPNGSPNGPNHPMIT